jgi:hypothetical protein
MLTSVWEVQGNVSRQIPRERLASKAKGINEVVKRLPNQRKSPPRGMKFIRLHIRQTNAPDRWKKPIDLTRQIMAARINCVVIRH